MLRNARLASMGRARATPLATSTPTPISVSVSHYEVSLITRNFGSSPRPGPSRLRPMRTLLSSDTFSLRRPHPPSPSYVSLRARQLSTLPPAAAAADTTPVDPTTSSEIDLDLSSRSPVSETSSSALLDATPVPSFLDPLIESLSDILISFPHPFGYGTSIILLTLVIRTAITLPISLWQRDRAMRAKRLVEPEMEIINERLAKSLAGEFRKKGYGYNQYLAELRRQLANAQSALHKKYSTHPFITTWAPLVVHLPIFITFSLTIRRALELPNSPLAADSFLWLNKLGEVDSQWILPLAGMAVAFGNAEMVGRKVRDLRTALGPGTGTVDTLSQSEALIAGADAAKVSDPKAASSSPSIPAGPSRPSSQPSRSEAPAPSSGLFTARSTSPTTPSRSNSNSNLSPPSPPPRPRHLSSSSSTPASASAPASAPSSRNVNPRNRNSSPPASSASASGSSQSPLVNVGMQDRPAAFSPARQAELRRNFMAGVLRFSALGFGMIASQMPSGLVLYWFTSLLYSFVQNIVFSLFPQRQAKVKRARAIAEESYER